MKVLQITRDFPPRVNGGLSSAVGGMVRALAGITSIDQAVVSFDRYRPARRADGAPTDAAPNDEDGIQVLRLEGPDQLPAAKAFARAFAPDVVHVHQAMLWEFATDVAAGAQRVFTVHLLQRLLRELRGLSEPTRSERDQRRALSEADAVAIPSEACRPHLPADVRERAHLVPLAVHDHQAARDAVDRERPHATFLYVARFGDVKGTQQLLEAIPRVDHPDVRFVLAGGLPDNPKADRRWRRRFAEQAPRAELVGWCDATRLTTLYATSTCLLAPSWFETFGLSALEAMLHGLPVLASDTGALPDLVQPGHTGWLVPPRDVEALAAAITRLIQTPAARQLGRQAAATARAHHLWPDRVTTLQTLYRRLA